jgi:hypothetical protein
MSGSACVMGAYMISAAESSVMLAPATCITPLVTFSWYIPTSASV